jgi:serine protease
MARNRFTDEPSGGPGARPAADRRSFVMSTSHPRIRVALAMALALALALIALATQAQRAHAAEYAPGQVVVRYEPRTAGLIHAEIARAGGVARTTSSPLAGVHVLHLKRGTTVSQEISRLRHQPGIAYAVPNYIAHAAGSWTPNDPGRTHTAGGWQQIQWNFMPQAGINMPEAWANMISDHHPGGTGVTIAILDTGVAYRDWKHFKRAPDFTSTQFVHPYDFVAKNRFPLDREGHGTFVAGIVAESTNNGVALTGIAYGAKIMPVRVLDRSGEGFPATIARGIVYAVNHGAQVINLSLEFDLGITSSDIPEILNAINYAHRHNVTVVAAAGNEGVDELAYPARAPAVISVGATTKDRCLADYSNAGPRLSVVAPGGGDDSSVIAQPGCDPNRRLPAIHSLTLLNPNNPTRFGYPNNVYGTSMAAPEVSGVAGLVIASRIIGRHPTPDQVLARLEQTSTPLGGEQPNENYGWGLINAGAATAPLTQTPITTPPAT